MQLHHFVDQHYQQRGQGGQQPHLQGNAGQAEGQRAALVPPQLVVHCGLNALAQQSGDNVSRLGTDLKRSCVCAGHEEEDLHHGHSEAPPGVVEGSLPPQRLGAVDVAEGDRH